jgi:hypothetical protein
MQDPPSATELLEAVASFLTDDLMPNLEGRERFHVRVAANLLRIVGREWTLEAGHREEDRRALAALLATDRNLEELADQLVDGIRTGELDMRESEVLDALRGIVRRKLSITNPSYIRDEAV